MWVGSTGIFFCYRQMTTKDIYNTKFYISTLSAFFTDISPENLKEAEKLNHLH